MQTTFFFFGIWVPVFIFSTVTYVVSSAIQTRAQSSVYQISMNNSPGVIPMDSDMTEGCIMVALTIFWCLLGLYAQGLAYRLYSSAKFIDMVRLHAKVGQSHISVGVNMKLDIIVSFTPCKFLKCFTHG